MDKHDLAIMSSFYVLWENSHEKRIIGPHSETGEVPYAVSPIERVVACDYVNLRATRIPIRKQHQACCMLLG
jgi:hypothetical protein